MSRQLPTGVNLYDYKVAARRKPLVKKVAARRKPAIESSRRALTCMTRKVAARRKPLVNTVADGRKPVQHEKLPQGVNLLR